MVRDSKGLHARDIVYDPTHSPGRQPDAADRLNGGQAIVAGTLRRQGGVEIRERFVVRVRSIKPAAP